MSLLKRVLCGACGTILLLVGVIMIFTPGPGVALIILGLMLLGHARVPLIDSLIEKIKAKFQKWICNNS